MNHEPLQICLINLEERADKQSLGRKAERKLIEVYLSLRKASLI